MSTTFVAAIVALIVGALTYLLPRKADKQVLDLPLPDLRSAEPVAWNIERDSRYGELRAGNGRTVFHNRYTSLHQARIELQLARNAESRRFGEKAVEYRIVPIHSVSVASR